MTPDSSTRESQQLFSQELASTLDRNKVSDKAGVRVTDETLRSFKQEIKSLALN